MRSFIGSLSLIAAVAAVSLSLPAQSWAWMDVPQPDATSLAFDAAAVVVATPDGTGHYTITRSLEGSLQPGTTIAVVDGSYDTAGADAAILFLASGTAPSWHPLPGGVILGHHGAAFGVVGEDARFNGPGALVEGEARIDHASRTWYATIDQKRTFDDAVSSVAIAVGRAGVARMASALPAGERRRELLLGLIDPLAPAANGCADLDPGTFAGSHILATFIQDKDTAGVLALIACPAWHPGARARSEFSLSASEQLIYDAMLDAREPETVRVRAIQRLAEHPALVARVLGDTSVDVRRAASAVEADASCLHRDEHDSLKRLGQTEPDADVRAQLARAAAGPTCKG